MQTQAETQSRAPADSEPELVAAIRQHVTFMREIVDRHFHGGAHAERYAARLATIEQRAADPRLYLAIIGEFCSGKSTFINAILRRRLLKAACSATTASITRIIRGSSFRVTAAFNDGTSITSTEDAFGELAQHVARLAPSAQPMSLQKTLELLTSEAAVANHVREVEVAVASEDLDEHLVILDTPGVGAGADNAAGHAALTESVMAACADCAVVLIPSISPMTNTLLQFLEEHARPFLHRCVFLITGADRLSAEDHDRVYAFVRQQLLTRLGLHEPPITFTAAIAMLPAEDVPKDLAERWEEWRPPFIRLELELRERLARQRIVIMAETLARLANGVIEELRRALSERLAALEAEKAHLEAHSVAAIDGVLEVLERAARTSVQAAASRIKSDVASRNDVFRVATIEHVEAALSQVSWDADTYEATVAPRVRAVIDHYGQAYGNEAAQQIVKLRNAVAKTTRQFGEQFEENYRSLRALEVKIAVPSVVVGDLGVEPISFHQSRPYIEQQHSTRRTGRNVGTGTGAILGGILFGPPGALIGALIGRAGGGAVSGDDFSALRERLKALIAADVAAYLNTYRTAIQNRVDCIASDVLKQFRAAARRHGREYGKTVAEMARLHDEQRAKVMTESRAVRRDAAELQRRAECLEALRRRLAAKGGAGE